MPNLLRLRESGPQWPYSVAQFRADEPQLSISDNPHEGELATYADLDPPILVFAAKPTDPPTHDPAIHRPQEVRPACVDGVWQQAWELIELPPPPEPEPQPDWAQFKLGLLTSPDVARIMANARAAGCEPAATALPVTLETAQTGRVSEFAACWRMVAVAGGATPKVIEELAAQAEACHLPEDFMNGLRLDS